MSIRPAFSVIISFPFPSHKTNTLETKVNLLSKKKTPGALQALVKHGNTPVPKTALKKHGKTPVSKLAGSRAHYTVPCPWALLSLYNVGTVGHIPSEHRHCT